MPFKRRRFRRGLSLIEVMIGVMVLALSVIAASTMFPMAAFLRDRSGGYSHASTILQRKMEQIRRLPYAQVTPSGLLNAGIIDSSASSPYPFTTVDALTSELASGAGTIVLSSGGTETARADVTLSWRGLRGTQHQLTATTFVSSRDVWIEP